MDLWAENLKEQLDEAYEFVKSLKNKGVWTDDMVVWTDKNGNLCAGKKSDKR